MPTEFICKIRESGGDYSSLASWEDAIDCDLTASSTKVFSGTLTGTISDGASVTLYRGGSSQGVTATVLHVTINGQIGLINISNPSFSFQSGDEWRVDSSNYFTISNSGDSMIAVAEIDGTWSSADTTPVNIGGWTVSSTNYVVVRAVGDSKASGQWSTTKYRLSVTNAAGGSIILTIGANYTRIIGIQVEANGASGHFVRLIGVYGFQYWTVAGCFLRKVGSGNYVVSGIRDQSTNYQRTIVNNVLYSNSTYNNASNAGILLEYGTAGGNNVIYNNTIYGFAYGIYQGASAPIMIVKNNICQNQSVRSYYIAATNKVCDYNLSGDSYDTGGQHDKTNQTVQFVDVSNFDFHLSSSDTAARNAGVDLSNDTYYAFSVDIDGEDRPGESYWDIGADEYVPVSSGYQLECLSGAVTLVGVDAGVLFSRVLTALGGSVSASGASSTLLLFRLLEAANGSVVIVGSPADLQYTPAGQYLLECLSGTVVLSGQQAATYLARLLGCDGGSITHAGNSSQLLLGRSLAALSGGVVVEGLNSTLLFDRRIVADSGTVVIVGNSAELTKGLTLSALGGEILVAGAGLWTGYDRRIFSNSGNIVIAGIPAVLTWTGQPVLVMGKRFTVTPVRRKYGIASRKIKRGV
ncbi:MAG: hypothetical protein QXW98_05315 [Candidatus Caldarchaeum sp.]